MYVLGSTIQADQSTTYSLYKLNPSGTLLSPSMGYNNSVFSDQTQGTIYDRRNDQLWIVGDGAVVGAGVGVVKSDGSVVFSENGVFRSIQGTAIDGAGNFWYTAHTDSVAAISPDGTPFIRDNYGNAKSAVIGPIFAGAIAIDAYGNLWVVDNLAHTITKAVGLAVPKNYQ